MKKTTIVATMIALAIAVLPLFPFLASANQSINLNDDRLPPGIKHAPGIEKRLDNGKGLPPGLFKKLGGHHSTTTPDTTAPRIIFVMPMGLKATSTSVIWVTNEASDSRIWISTTTPVNVSGLATQSSTSRSYFHQLELTGLATSTQYYYSLSSTDASGNTGTSTGHSFTTLAI